MTKAEAKAIHESACRAIRVLNQVDLMREMTEVPMDTRADLYARYKGALDEVTRINDMALAELEGRV